MSRDLKFHGFIAHPLAHALGCSAMVSLSMYSLSHLLPYLLCKKGGHVTLHEKREFPADSTHGWCIVAMVNFLVSRMVAPLILRSWETGTIDEISRKADIWLIYLLSLQDQIVSWSNRFCVHWKLGDWVKRNLVSGLQPFENREFICS